MDNELAPTGRFRVGMNGSNPTLVIRNADGTVSGLSADLGRFIAGKLGVPYEPVVYESSTPFTASFGKGEWEIILTGKNAVVAGILDFGPDVALMEYGFLSAPGREFASVAAVDAPGVRIAVPRRASADVFLSRTLKAAEVVPMDGDSSVATEWLKAGKADVFATNINSLHEVAERLPGAEIVGAFNTVTFSLAMHKSLSSGARTRLAGWVEEAKASGLVHRALAHERARGVRVAP